MQPAEVAPTAPGARPPSRATGFLRAFAPFGWVALYAGVSAALHFAVVSVPWDTDTAYHVAVGRLIREHGILRSFPWTPFSWLADHYADKELLFHLLFVPLAGMPWITAAKVVGMVSGTALLTTLYLVLRAEGVRLAGLWALVPLLASDVFVFRFALVRPHVLSIALAVVVLWAAVRGRFAVLAAACALYPWIYVAWVLPIVLVAIAEVARLASGERPRLATAAWAMGGIAAGLALHPNAANLVRFTWIVLVDVLLRGAWGGSALLEMGREFEPFSPGQWAQWLLGASAMALAALALAWRDRRAGPVPLAFALTAAAFGVLTLRTARFAEYFVPLSAAALALAVQRLRWRLAPVVAPVAVAVALALYSGPALAETLRGLASRPDRLPDAIGAALRREIPEGAQVFTCDWDRTGDLLLALPGRRFVVALDPTLFLVRDPELYRLWFEIPRRPPSGVSTVIRERFGAQFVVCFWNGRFRRFFDQIAFEPDVRTALLTEDWNVYELRPPAASTEPARP